MSKSTTQPRRCQFTVKGGGRCPEIAFHKIAGGSRVCMEHAAASTIGGNVQGGFSISPLYQAGSMDVFSADKQQKFPNSFELPYDAEYLEDNVVSEILPSQWYFEDFDTGKVILDEKTNKMVPEIRVRLVQYAGKVADVTDKHVKSIAYFLQKKFPEFRSFVR